VKFTERRKRPTIANVAITRALAGWCCPWPSSRSNGPPICFVIGQGWWQSVQRLGAQLPASIWQI
jgi:hypothetical protein